MRNQKIVNKRTSRSRQDLSQAIFCRVPTALTYPFNLTQKLHSLTQKFIVLVSDMIYNSLRFRPARSGACAILTEPLELEKKSRPLVLLANGDLCRARHGLGNSDYSADGVDGKNKSLPRALNRCTGYRWFLRRLIPTGKYTAPIF